MHELNKEKDVVLLPRASEPFATIGWCAAVGVLPVYNGVQTLSADGACHRENTRYSTPVPMADLVLTGVYR